ncbi:MAG: M23 family metallopeptidase [Clostridia bacterium]|nr:M23 family metallopeptidase [Clostridia bacterium]
MAENSDALYKLTNAAQTAQAVRGAVKTGKTVAAAAKGAAAGGPYGAIASAAWNNRKVIGKAIAAIMLVLAIPILFVVMLPGLIFGDLSDKQMNDALNNDAVIMTNIEQAQNVISESISEAHSNVLNSINSEILKLPDGATSKIEDNFTGAVIMNINMLISQYCASKDDWRNINTDDLKMTVKSHESELFTYTVTTSTEGKGENAHTVYTYTVQYVGDDQFREIFNLDETKLQKAYYYAENLTTYLYGRELVTGTAAVSAEVERYAGKISEYAKANGISGFEAVIKCVMMAESGGRGTDVMQCSECPYNTRFSHKPNSITDVNYSIEVGIKYLAECLGQAGCTSASDIPKLSLALQGYNYGNGYIDWALKKYGGYSQANAQEFSNMMKAKLGWSSYGNPNYVSAVLKYYMDTSMSGTGSTGWGSPFPGRDWKSVVTSEYGYRIDPVTGEKGKFHAGLDIGMPAGTPISAVKEGVVTAANYYTTGYGYHVIIDHGGGYQTLYGHCSTLLVNVGDKVTKGQVIAKVGSTGKSTGPHLHINVYQNGETMNPRNYLN